jgi:hypothetical protein
MGELLMKHFFALTLLSLTLMLSACDYVDDGKKPKVTAEEVVKDEIKNKILSIKNKAEQEREEYATTIQKEMDEMSTQIEAFSEKVEKATGEGRVELTQQLYDLKQEQNEVKQKIIEMKSETIEKWHGLKAGVSDAIANLKHSIQQVVGDKT